jgi:5-methylcytosine-specific restriction endonuclease McrA
MKAQGGKCAYCKASLKDGSCIDHIVPLAKGGPNSAANIQMLCRPCNSKKAAKDPLAFAAEIGLLL